MSTFTNTLERVGLDLTRVGVPATITAISAGLLSTFMFGSQTFEFDFLGGLQIPSAVLYGGYNFIASLASNTINRFVFPMLLRGPLSQVPFLISPLTSGVANAVIFGAVNAFAGGQFSLRLLGMIFALGALSDIIGQFVVNQLDPFLNQRLKDVQIAEMVNVGRNGMPLAVPISAIPTERVSLDRRIR